MATKENTKKEGKGKKPQKTMMEKRKEKRLEREEKSSRSN